ncbi:MAG: radical SAM protein, partial [Deltaproteobacteria bacterium]|nr:radical SAM protein [Deltaproteobacteria bacterium]
ESAELSRRLRAAGHFLTIETAGTVACPGVDADLMSISPKLSHSTPWERAEAEGKPTLAQRHEAARIDEAVLRELLTFPWQLKFVVRTSQPDQLDADLREIDALLERLRVRAGERDQVLLMPEGIEAKQLERGYRALVEPCRTRGYRLGVRLHIHIFGHTPGT